MGTRSLRHLRPVIISLDDYERLHEHADVGDALRVRDLRTTDFTAMSLEDMLAALGVVR